MRELVGCPECSRHVRASETSCPFCSSPLTPPEAKRRVAALLGSGLLFGGCAGAQGPDNGGSDGAVPLGDAGDAGHAGDASARVGDNEEAYSFVPVYGASGCDFAPASPSAPISPILGGAVIAAAAVAILRGRRSPS